MPGAVPITSTYALTNATMPFVLKLADEGVHRALAYEPRASCAGSTSPAGKVTYEPVARDQGLEYTPGARRRCAGRSPAGRDGAAGQARCYHLAPHADDQPARSARAAPPSQEARHPRA